MDDEALLIQQSGLITQLLGNSAAAQSQAHGSAMEAIAAKSKASAAQRAVRLTDSDAMFAMEEVKKKQHEIERAREQVLALQQKIESLMTAISDRDEIIVDWMQSNEAFKRLARQYGKKAGISDEQRQVDYLQHVVDLAEEDPTFSDTDKTKRAKEKLSSRMK